MSKSKRDRELSQPRGRTTRAHITRRSAMAGAGAALGLGPLLSAAAKVEAQGSEYPNKPIRFVVPFPAGSPLDTIGRKLGEAVAKKLGVAVVIDNKTGAGGTIGSADVARAPPDGYNFLVTIGDALISSTVTMKSLPYDSEKDFDFISKIIEGVSCLIMNPGLKPNTLAELVEDAKRPGADWTYGAFGPGSFPHLLMEALNKKAGVKLRAVQYRGSPPALQDLLANQIAITFTAPNVAAPMVAAGKVKAIALTGEKRSPLMPNVPTFTEAGFTDFVFRNVIWVGLLGPAKLPAPIKARIASAAQSSLREPELRDSLTALGFDVIGNSPEEFERQFRNEYKVITALMREMGITPQ